MVKRKLRPIEHPERLLANQKIHFCHLLREMVKDEHKAYTSDYPKLVKASKGKVPKRFVKDIRRNIKDEHRHYGVVDGYYRYVCGRQR